MEDTKFLLIIVVVLAAIFIIGGSITGGAISIFRAKPIATTPTTTLQAVPTTGQGCISLTTGQCETICGGVVTTSQKCIPQDCVGCDNEIEKKECYRKIFNSIKKMAYLDCIWAGFDMAWCREFFPPKQ